MNAVADVMLNPSRDTAVRKQPPNNVGPGMATSSHPCWRWHLGQEVICCSLFTFLTRQERVCPAMESPKKPEFLSGDCSLP